MRELICKECGARLKPRTTECQSCGCPIEEANVDYPTITNVPTVNNLNVRSIISLLLGVVIVIMGITVMNKEVTIGTYGATHYDVDYASFGADFYTEIYGASDIIVDELNDINGGIKVLSEAMAIMANVIYYPIGMMIVALGLGVIAVSCNYIKKEKA